MRGAAIAAGFFRRLVMRFRRKAPRDEDELQEGEEGWDPDKGEQWVCGCVGEEGWDPGKGEQWVCGCVGEEGWDPDKGECGVPWWCCTATCMGPCWPAGRPCARVLLPAQARSGAACGPRCAASPPSSASSASLRRQAVATCSTLQPARCLPAACLCEVCSRRACCGACVVAGAAGGLRAALLLHDLPGLLAKQHDRVALVRARMLLARRVATREQQRTPAALVANAEKEGRAALGRHLMARCTLYGWRGAKEPDT